MRQRSLIRYASYKYDDKISQLVRLDEFLTHTQEVILLVGCLLDYVEEGVLHYYLGRLKELVVQEQVLVVRVVLLALCLTLVHDLHELKGTLQPMPIGSFVSSMSRRGVSSFYILSKRSSISLSLRALLKMLSKTWSSNDFLVSVTLNLGASLMLLI
jgi:hypothetical protein